MQSMQTSFSLPRLLARSLKRMKIFATLRPNCLWQLLLSAKRYLPDYSDTIDKRSEN